VHLLVLWGVLILWWLALGGAVRLIAMGYLVVAGQIARMGGCSGLLLILLLGVLTMLLVATVSVMFMAASFRSIGMLGRDHRELLAMIAGTQSVAATAGFLGGGLVLSGAVCALLLYNAGARVLDAIPRPGPPSLTKQEPMFPWGPVYEVADGEPAPAGDAMQQTALVQGMAQMQAVQTAMVQYAYRHQRNYPPDLAALVAENLITPEELRSPTGEKAPYIYIPHQRYDGRGVGGEIVLIDPTVYEGGKRIVLLRRNAVRIFSTERFAETLAQQGYRPDGTPVAPASAPASQRAGSGH